MQCDVPGFFQPDHGRVSGLLRFRVLARSLSELLGRLGDVENVDNGLKGQPDIVAKTGEGTKLRSGAVGAHAAEPNRTAEQRGSFSFVNVFQFLGADFLSFS